MKILKRTWTLKDKDGDDRLLDGEPIERSAWIVRYTDQNGGRHIKTFALKKDADGWGTTVAHEVKQGIHTAASVSNTVTEATELWIQHCEAEGLEFGTIKQRRQHLNLHITPYIGREKLSSLTTPRVYAFDAQLRDAGRSVEMRRKVLTNLKTMLTFAQGRGLVAQNVARGVKIKSDDRHTATGPLKEGRDFPSKTELKALIDNASDRWRPFLVTAIFTGMRASELRGLRWSDVDLEAGTIHVAQRADAWGHIGSPKSAAGTRDIPCTPLVINSLRQWKGKKESSGGTKSESPEKPTCPTGELGLVFPNGAGNIEAHPNIIKRVWNPLQIKAAVCIDTGKVDAEGNPILAAKYGFHAIRHAAASLFIATLGWTPKRVQSVMGHSSITMTFDRYGHLFEDRDGDKKAMEKLEAAIVAA